jgi:hypothetical protein
MHSFLSLLLSNSEILGILLVNPIAHGWQNGPSLVYGQRRFRPTTGASVGATPILRFGPIVQKYQSWIFQGNSIKHSCN